MTKHWFPTGSLLVPLGEVPVDPVTGSLVPSYKGTGNREPVPVGPETLAEKSSGTRQKGTTVVPSEALPTDAELLAVHAQLDQLVSGKPIGVA